MGDWRQADQCGKETASRVKEDKTVFTQTFRPLTLKNLKP